MLVLAIIMLSVAFAYFINWNGDGLALQWAFTIVFVFYVLLAALLGYLGCARSNRSVPRARDRAGREIPERAQAGKA